MNVEFCSPRLMTSNAFCSVSPHFQGALRFVRLRSGAMTDARFGMNRALYVAVDRKLLSSADVVGGDIPISALMCFCCTDTPCALNVCP